jgi:MYXO-CTERM domain-containing protein
MPADPGEQQALSTYPPFILPQRSAADGGNGLDPSSVFGPLTKANTPNTMLPLFSQPSLGDMDQDGSPDIVATGGSLTLALNIQSPSDNLKGDNLLAMWSVKTGKMLPASPMLLEDFTFLNSSSVADLTGDGYPEAIIGSGGYYLHAYDGCAREPEGWPKFTGQWIIPTPVVGDIDGDGTLEVAVGTRNGWLYAWHTGASDQNVIEWESYHHDNRNTGNYDLPLEQGGPRTAKEPLTEATCAEPVPVPEPEDERYSVAGGCTCETSDAGSTGGAKALLALGVLGLLATRRSRTSAKARS